MNTWRLFLRGLKTRPGLVSAFTGLFGIGVNFLPVWETVGWKWLDKPTVVLLLASAAICFYLTLGYAVEERAGDAPPFYIYAIERWEGARILHRMLLLVLIGGLVGVVGIYSWRTYDRYDEAATVADIREIIDQLEELRRGLLPEPRPDEDRGLDRPSVVGLGLLERTESGAMRSVENGGRLRSGSVYQLEIELSESGYVYAFQAEAAGGFQLLHPALGDSPHARGANPVAGVSTLMLPDATSGFELSQDVGWEQIVVVFSRKALPHFDRLLLDLEALSPGAIKARANGRRSVAAERKKLWAALEGTVTQEGAIWNEFRIDHVH